MFYMMMFFILSMILSLMVMKISLFFSKKIKYDLEKMSPFECGFDPMISSRVPFSSRFFLITIIFLIFDVELAILIPLIKTFYSSMKINWLITTIILIIILLMGIFHEWNQGMLNWAN